MRHSGLLPVYESSRTRPREINSRTSCKIGMKMDPKTAKKRLLYEPKSRPKNKFRNKSAGNSIPSGRRTPCLSARTPRSPGHGAHRAALRQAYLRNFFSGAICSWRRTKTSGSGTTTRRRVHSRWWALPWEKSPLSRVFFRSLVAGWRVVSTGWWPSQRDLHWDSLSKFTCLRRRKRLRLCHDRDDGVVLRISRRPCLG